jgi:hypothetical protein
MGIRIGQGEVRRKWGKLASAAGETIFQALALGKDGFSAAISAFFRTLENLHGNDSTELRATRLVIETLSYAVSATIATSPLSRKPTGAEAQFIVGSLIDRAETLASQGEILLETEHLENPATFPLYEDAARGIFFELRFCEPKESEADVVARFIDFVSEGLNRIRTRDPEYFSPILTALSGPDALSDARVRAWQQYRALLVRRFEDEPLFGEDRPHGVTLGQVYQPLRAWWDDFDEEKAAELSAGGIETEAKAKTPPINRHICKLDESILEWLNTDSKADRVRLVSGGPGSGKSTFARWLAARLAPEPRWRIVFVPLQRLKGSGPLEARIDEYFRLQLEEPFDAETVPLLSVGRDGHRD